jgi:hypothetical protein
MDGVPTVRTNHIGVTIAPIGESRRRVLTIGWTVAGVIAAAYAVIFGLLSAFSLQDYPNHLARAVAISDLIFDGGARFGALFQFHYAAVSYVLGDLTLAWAVHLFGPELSTILWIALVILSLPLALLFYLRGSTVAPEGRMLVFLLSLYLSTDAFLFMGFLTFRLGVTVTLVSFALVQSLRRSWSTALFAAYCVTLVLGYLTHLSVIVFLVAAIGVSAVLNLWSGRTTKRTEILLSMPLLVVLAWHFAAAIHYRVPTDLPAGGFDWGTWSGKIWRLHWDFMRYYGTRFDRRVDETLALMGALCVLWPLRTQLRIRNFSKPAVLEMLALAATFAGIYILLPSSYGDGSYMDLRPLVFVPLFLMIASAYLPEGDSPPYRSGVTVAVALAALLASANLVYLTWHLVEDNVWIKRYRAVVAAVPRGARVLPLYPGTDEVKPFMHAASFVVIDRGGVIPYLFTGNRGNPQTYFRYIRLPYAPPENWYYEPAPPATDVDWKAVACTYDFLLPMKPFPLTGIPIPSVKVIENGSAALLAIRNGGCAGSG